MKRDKWIRGFSLFAVLGLAIAQPSSYALFGNDDENKQQEDQALPGTSQTDAAGSLGATGTAGTDTLGTDAGANLGSDESMIGTGTTDTLGAGTSSGAGGMDTTTAAGAGAAGGDTTTGAGSTASF